MHSCFFPRLTAKITFMLKSQLSQTRKTHREISFMCMYIFFLLYIHRSFQTVYIPSYFFYTKSLPANPHQYHLPQVSSCNPPCLENVCACILEMFQPKSFETKNLLRGHLYVVLEVSENLCFSGARFAEPNVPLGTRDFAGCLGMMIIDLVKF